MNWMMWSIEKGSDPYGIDHYRRRHGVLPSMVEAPINFPEDETMALASALGIPATSIIKTRTCIPGIILLSHQETESQDENFLSERTA